MRKSITSEIKNILNMKARRFFALLSFSILSLATANAQPPTWVIGTPSVVGTTPYSITANYGINMVGTIYVAVFNTNVPCGFYSSSDIKWYAQQPLGGQFVAKGVIAINAGDVNNTLQTIFNVSNPNTLHTIFIVAEGTPGGLQALPTCLYPTTQPCPPIDMDFGYSTPQTCINKGINQSLRFTIYDDNPDISGVYPGTTFLIKWGDGNTTTWTTTAIDYMTAGVPKSFSHGYAMTTNCNYEIEAVITSSCSPIIKKQFKTYVIIHGRDVPSDGDGALLIQDAVSPFETTTIPVCEGNTHLIQLKDMSTWDCQNPTFLDLTPAPANNSIRTVQWVYGMDNSETVSANTIGSTLNLPDPVVIGGTNNVTRALPGYDQAPISPATYQGELSQTIFIPATCRAGEYFDVYLRNWNKCNVFGLDPAVFTTIRILVVASPAPPTVTDRTICLGNPTTLTIGHGVPAGTVLSWYANSDKTGFLANGTTYSPVIGSTGTYTYYVADQGNVSGSLCEGPAAPITLTVNSILTAEA
jgi:hypothetical protein